MASILRLNTTSGSIIRQYIANTSVASHNNTNTKSLLLLCSRRWYHNTIRSTGGGGHHHGPPPPMPPFARSPPCFEKLVENRDCVWDDGVAPELALDFDAPFITSREALLTLLSVFGVFTLFYQFMKITYPINPALEHETDVVYPDYSQPPRTNK